MVIVVSRSFVGVTEEILNQVEEEKAFFDKKFFFRIKLERINEETSKEFLSQKFKEEGIKVKDQVIEEVIKLFNGIRD
ncbi:hypothetical protein [Sulfurisphaera ohwakuensis]|uniref:hypothetical protein n=1 Tax=Sulfurisphaera ohwakuensis TaxID=69656 RepID=UPI0036F41167